MVSAPTDAASLISAAQAMRAQVARRIVGQTEALDEILLAIVAGGHALLVGVPGLAKTMMVRAVSEAMQLDFRRIQFTPDLVPSDITGTELLEEDSATGHRAFRFVRGPIFANIVLADEINRAPAEDAGRAAGGDAGVSRHGRGADHAAAGAVLRARDAEPHRAGGHLSPA
ncbi:MAG: AAA family ATPase [Gemmatimonadaceae bacterium]|nr:AAA family ATPase [Gemmatimonadaceae bacterium]